MRTLKTKLGGKQAVLTASFAASVRIAKEVADPLLISREIVKEAMFGQQGLPYTAEWSMSVENVTQIITIGLQATDDSITEEEVQDLVFDTGYIAAQGIVLDYLAMLVEPRSRELPKTPKKNQKTGETAGK